MQNIAQHSAILPILAEQIGKMGEARAGLGRTRTAAGAATSAPLLN